MTEIHSKPETEQTISPDYAEILRLVRKYRRYQDKTLADIFVRVGRELENSRPKSDRCPKCFRTNIEHERLLNPTCQSPWHDVEQITKPETAKRRPAPTYGDEVYDLAALFLSDTPDKDTEENRDELARWIQSEIESHIEFILKPRE